VRRSVVVTIPLGDAPAEAIGGKARGLARLLQLGLPVPDTLVLPVGAELTDVDAVIRKLGEPLAVRSSAVGEDAADRSAAGQYETVLHVGRGELADAVARVKMSTGRAAAYGGGDDIAVVIQRQIPATKAGVAFSRDPVTGSERIVVECAFGSGEAVVSGTVTPDRYRLEHGSVETRAATPLRTLRDDELEELAVLVRRAEAGFEAPVDVEFCFEQRRLWLLQCRPITTL
jgi:phosphoenolpyruvate synthase/pyruvate phosphate dikinase